MAAPTDPDDEPIRPVLSAAFWAMMGLAAACLAAASLFALAAPRLFVKPAPAASGSGRAALGVARREGYERPSARPASPVDEGPP